MSLVHGSLSDAVGRRRVVLVGLVLYALAPWLSQSMQRLALTAFSFSVAGWCVWRLARRYQRRLPAYGSEYGPL